MALVDRCDGADRRSARLAGVCFREAQAMCITTVVCQYATLRLRIDYRPGYSHYWVIPDLSSRTRFLAAQYHSRAGPGTATETGRKQAKSGLVRHRKRLWRML